MTGDAVLAVVFWIAVAGGASAIAVLLWPLVGPVIDHLLRADHPVRSEVEIEHHLYPSTRRHLTPLDNRSINRRSSHDRHHP